MTATRRNVLLQGCVIGAGIIATNMPGMVALAQAGPKLRRSLTGMALNDPNLSTWRDGIRLLAFKHGSDDPSVVEAIAKLPVRYYLAAQNPTAFAPYCSEPTSAT